MLAGGAGEGTQIKLRWNRRGTADLALVEPVRERRFSAGGAGEGTQNVGGSDLLGLLLFDFCFGGIDFLTVVNLM